MNRDTKLAAGMSTYFLVCLLAMVWPGAAIANRIEPTILGLPFFFFWYVAWVLLVFLGCLILYRLKYGGRSEGDS